MCRFACHLSLLFLLSGCNEFERAAYRTLAVTQAEYETVQARVAEAAAHGLLTEQQWNRFAVQGHRFIDAHNATVDAFELWSRVQDPSSEARLRALLDILPRLIQELNRLAESFDEEPRDRSQKSEVRSQNDHHGTRQEPVELVSQQLLEVRTVRARLQPCRKEPVTTGASAPEGLSVLLRCAIKHVIPRSASGEGPALLLTTGSWLLTPVF